MAKKRDDYEEEAELRELLEALRESYEELTAGSDAESGALAFLRDQGRETVYIKCSDGDYGSIPSAEFQEITDWIGDKCLVCAGSLGLIFDSESRPVLYLVCDKCEAVHKVALGELCLFDQ